MSGLDLSCRSSLWAYGKTAALCGALCGLLPAASATESRKVLVLSVSEGGRQQDGMRSEIGQLLQRAGAQLIDSSSLPSTDRSCEEPSCLRRIVDEQKVDLVLATRIERRQRHERLVDMWIYDAETSRDHSTSDLCDARDLKECLGSIAGRLASPLLDPAAKVSSPQRSIPSVQPASDLKLTAAKAARVSRPVSGGRIALGVMLGALGAGALATGVWAHVKNGDPKVKDERSGQLNTLPLFAPAYAVAGASFLGMSLSFFLPSTTTQERAR